MGEYRLLMFLTICRKLNILWHFEVFVNTGPYGLQIQNDTPTVFIVFFVYEDIGYRGGIQAITITKF